MQTPGRNWAEDDRMVNTDFDTSTFLPGDESVRERDTGVPLIGERNSLGTPAWQTMCVKSYDDNPDDFILEAYASCVLQFTPRQFERSINFD